MRAVLVFASLTMACAARTSPTGGDEEPLVTFGPGATPAMTNVDQGYDTELGVELWSDVGGTVNGVRFYKGSADTGPHLGHVWDKATGALLATAQFTGETATGWQEAQFVPAVAIPAGTHVIASYHTTTGFSWTEYGYQNPVDAPPLHVPAQGGVYAFGPSPDPQRPPLFPGLTYHSSSYWVDVDFHPYPSEASDTLFDASLAPPTEIPSSTSYELGLRFKSDVDGALHGVRFYKTPHDGGTHAVHVWDASGNLVATAGSQEESPAGWQEVAISVPIAAGQTYVASYSTAQSFPAQEHAFDGPVDRPPLHAPVAAGVYAPSGTFPTQVYANASYFVDVDFEPNGAPTSPGSRVNIWTPADGPIAPGYQGPASYELGTRFTVGAAGAATALRYYKDANATASTVGHLWAPDGFLLATAHFAAGTTHGWQEAALDHFVELQPGRELTVSYVTTNGFAYSPDYFDTFGHGQPPVVAPVGAGVYGPVGSRPTQTWMGASYWADLVFQPYAPTESLFPPWFTPVYTQYSTSTPFELGVRFQSQTAGYLTEVRFYKGAGNDGPHVGHVWDANGNLIATAPFTNETATGWQRAPLPPNLFVPPGTTYVVSISTSTGFAWTQDFFDHAYSSAPFAVPTSGGVWAAAGSFPTQSYVGSNYWVDFTFEPWLPGCTPQCSGRTCGDIDGCGGICCSGSGCAPVQGCDPTCQTTEGCGNRCETTCQRTLPPARPLGFNLPFLLDYYFTPAPLGTDEARREMRLAAQRGITWARFFASLNWPEDATNPVTGWLGNREQFFARYDALVADARAAGLHLVPCLIGNTFLWGDLATPQEPRGRLFVPGSKARLLFEQYVTDLVSRYKDDDTILFWEIGNELNLDADIFPPVWSCDLSNADTGDDGGCHDTCVRGAPCRRDQRDNYYTCDTCRGVSSEQEDLGAFNHDIAALIHRIDPTRKVSSGVATMRRSAWHLSRKNTYPTGSGFEGLSDTPDQYAEILLHLHADGVDLISTHPYFSDDSSRFGDTDVSGGEFVSRTQAVAEAHGKQLMVGEYSQFGVGTHGCGPDIGKLCGGIDATLDPSRRMTDIIVADGVAYGSLFAYESAPLNPECPRDLSCGTADDSPIVDYIAQRNQGGGPPGITPAPATTVLRQWNFADSDGVTGWTQGEGTGTGTFRLMSFIEPALSGGLPPLRWARLAADDFACGGCLKYYNVRSPVIPVQPGGGTITVNYYAAASGTNAQIDIHQLGSASGEHLALAAVSDETFATNGVTAQLWPDTTGVQIGLRVNDSQTNLDVWSVVVTQGVKTDPWPPR